MIGVQRQVRIAEEQLEPCAALVRVGQRLGQRRLGLQCIGVQLLLYPVEEHVGDRLTVIEPV
jgi:hypothetical protein